MYKKILIPMALDHGIGVSAIGIARQLLDEGGEIVALHVYEAPHSSVRTYLDDDTISSAFQAARDRLKQRVADHEGVTPVILAGHTGRTIAEYADEIGADCIVIGSHKPGLKDYFLGSTAARVVRHAPCSVHVLR